MRTRRKPNVILLHVYTTFSRTDIYSMCIQCYTSSFQQVALLQDVGMILGRHGKVLKDCEQNKVMRLISHDGIKKNLRSWSYKTFDIVS